MANLWAGKSKISIELDQQAYYLDQQVTGTLCLDVTRKIEIYCLCIYMFGKEKIWMEVGKGRQAHHIKDVKNFLETTTYLLGEPEGKGHPPATAIPAGHYEYQFAIDLPSGADFPPSIEIGKCGVYYGLWGHVEDSGTWSANKKKTTKRKKSSQVKEAFTPFTVVGSFLKEPPAFAPVNLTMMKKFLLTAKPLEINIKIARNVFLPGETIDTIVTFSNQTSKRVKFVETQFQPYIYQKVKKREFNRRMPALYHEKWPDTQVKANSTRRFDIQLECAEDIFPTLTSPELLHYTHVLLYRVHVTGEPFIDVAVPITILCNVEESRKMIADAKAAATEKAGYGEEALEKNKESCCTIM
mmetsp:Transcript_56/g.187  ORF Transcript_56/g.187 Transcript_56/m.187 type:complete len:355 (+) Transcript_56:252-1316(+)